jgi:hypothetical protein
MAAEIGKRTFANLAHQLIFILTESANPGLDAPGFTKGFFLVIGKTIF